MTFAGRNHCTNRVRGLWLQFRALYQIVARESGLAMGDARALVQLAHRLRGLHDRGLAEVPSTRLLIAAGLLAVRGIDLRRACWHAVVAPLSDEPSLVAAMRDLVDATFV